MTQRTKLTVFMGLASLLAAACPALPQCSCSIDARVTKGTKRPNGNSVQGYSVAWAASGDYYCWSAIAHGSLYFNSGGGAIPVGSGTQSGGLNGLGESGGPQWSKTTDLESHGNGEYWQTGFGDFFDLCGDAYYNQLYGESPHRSVTRPAVTVPTLPPGSDRFGFWYLGGQPSIDGYYVQAQLSGIDNWAPATGESIGSRS